MRKPTKFTFPNKQFAYAVRVRRIRDLHDALDSLNIQYPRPTLVLVGGANGMSIEELARIRHLFTEVLAPLAESLGLAIVDGGTDAGIMQLMGQVRHKIGGTFPLIGVAALGTITLPHIPHFHTQQPQLEPYHSHFVLVLGSKWGNESPWIARTATILAEGVPSATLLINGGEITWKDAAESIKANRPVVVVAGSGRTADKIANALRGIPVNDRRADKLIASGLLHEVNLLNDFYELNEVIKKLFY
jgi:hypothetical protein